MTYFGRPIAVPYTIKCNQVIGPTGREVWMADPIDELIRNNDRYSIWFRKGQLPAPPALRLTIVTCMDARINVFALLDIKEGDAHVLRNAGGVVTDDVIRSLILSQHLLGTRSILLIHHTGCGLHGLDEAGLRDQIRGETGQEPPFAFGAFDDLDAAVRESIGRIRADPFLKLTEVVRGFVYDVKSGRLREVAPEGGR